MPKSQKQPIQVATELDFPKEETSNLICHCSYYGPISWLLLSPSADQVSTLITGVTPSEKVPGALTRTTNLWLSCSMFFLSLSDSAFAKGVVHLFRWLNEKSSYLSSHPCPSQGCPPSGGDRASEQHLADGSSRGTCVGQDKVIKGVDDNSQWAHFRAPGR